MKNKNNTDILDRLLDLADSDHNTHFEKKVRLRPIICIPGVNLIVLTVLVLIAVAIGYFGFSSVTNPSEYGSYCTRDSDCVSGLACVQYACNCSLNTYYNTTIENCAPVKTYLALCQSSLECCCGLSCSSNSINQSNVCGCLGSGFYDSSLSTCTTVSTYARKCDYDSDCSISAGLVCLNYKCECSQPDLYSWNGSYCDHVQVNGYMQSCVNNQQCNSSQNLECQIYGSTPNKCACSTSYIWNASEQICQYQPLPGYQWDSETNQYELSYGQSCGVCDSNKNLTCNSKGKCVCMDGTYWTGKYCGVLLTYGIKCANSYQCDSSLNLVCNSTYSLCMCSSSGNYAWNGSYCEAKQMSNGSSCVSDYQCRDSVGLYCINNQCVCNTTKYWSSGYCVDKKAMYSSCTYNAECMDYLGMDCVSFGSSVNMCACALNRYWTGTDCALKKGYNGSCAIDYQCQQDLGLVCPNSTCGCRNLYYWSGTKCESMYAYGAACSMENQCNSQLNLRCVNSTCSCPSFWYWDGTQCSQQSIAGGYCNSTGPLCQTFAGLVCISNICQCSSGKVWIASQRKCQNYMGINQHCDNQTYYCTNGLVCYNSISTQGTGICMCPYYQYWTGSACANLLSYGQACVRGACDGSKYLNCLSNGVCGCDSSMYWTGSACSP